MKSMIQPPPTITGAADPNAAPPPGTTTGPSGGASPGVGGGIDLVKIKQYLHIVVRRIWIIALCFAAALIISVIQVSKQESFYHASTSILLTRGTLLPGQFSSEQNIFGDFMDTQVRVMNSRSVMTRARENLGMSEGEVRRLLRSVSIWPIGRSSVVSISVQSRDGKFSADYANAIAQAYVEFKEEERVGLSQTTSINLMQQSNRIREELRKAEEALVLFKRDNTSVLTQREGNIAASVMSDLERRTAAHRLERMVLELQRPLLSDASDDVILTALSSRYIPLGPSINVSSSGTGSGAQESMVASPQLGRIDFDTAANSEWEGLRRQKKNLEHEIRMAREYLRDSHPTVRKLLQEMRTIDSAINREVQFATEKYYAELEALTLKETSLTRVKSLWLDEAMEAELVMDRFDMLRNDVDRLRRLLDAVFARIREIDISAGIIPDNVTVMEEAIPNFSPTTPRRVQSIFLAGLIGIGIGLGIVFGLDFLDDSVRYPEDVTRALDLRFLGIIPAASWNEGDIRSHLLSKMDQKSGMAEAYRNIRAALVLDDQTKNSRSFLITSSLAREGKTTTSLNIAISLAQAGLRVLLVDADMRRGGTHKYFGLEGGRGFSDILSGQAKPESVIQRTGVANLDLVATGPFPATPAELIMRAEFRSFLDFAKRSYDKIVFDGPPVMAVSEAAVLSGLVDSTLMVVWAGKTSRKLCQLTIQNLLQRGGRIDGCILNNLEFGRVGYYYYSTYYGYYTYDYRYDSDTPRTSTTAT